MKEIQLTQGLVTMVDNDDFDHLNKYKWCAAKSGKTYYAIRSINNSNGRQRVVRMHRFITNTIDPSVIIDHKDHNGLNNQRYNLRTCTKSENATNRNYTSIGISKYCGVSLHKKTGRWVAYIRKNGKLKHIGCYDNQIDAAIAYNNAAQKEHGGFSNLNNIINN